MNLIQALLHRGVPFHRSPTDVDEITICCPFCSQKGETPDTRFRLGINLRRNLGQCFNCGWKSRHAVSYLGKHLGVLAEAEGDSEPKIPEKVEWPEGFVRLTSPDTDLDRMAYAYLRNRGVSRTQIQVKKIGVTYQGRFAYRIIFPVLSKGELKGFVARDFTGNQEPRYLNSLGDRYLYNFRPQRSLRGLILFEGIIKALRGEQMLAHHQYQSVATLGAKITPTQIEQILSSGIRQIAIWPDPDRPGRHGALYTAEKLLEAGIHMVKVVWPVTEPADDLPLKAFGPLWKSRSDYNWAMARRLEQGV